MKQTIFGASREEFQKRLRARIILCVCVFCAILMIHGVCTWLRTEQNHTAMLLLNIAADILGGSFLIAQLNIYVLPQLKSLKLYDLAAQETTGQVVEIGESAIHYIGVDCLEVHLPDRRLFLPVGTITLTVGAQYRFRLKGNLVVEVCAYDPA